MRTAIQITRDMVRNTLDSDSSSVVRIVDTYLDHKNLSFQLTEDIMFSMVSAVGGQDLAEMFFTYGLAFQITKSMIRRGITDHFADGRVLSMLIRHDPAFPAGEKLLEFAFDNFARPDVTKNLIKNVGMTEELLLRASHSSTYGRFVASEILEAYEQFGITLNLLNETTQIFEPGT